MANQKKEQKKKWKERHQRLPKEDVNILDYHPLIRKTINRLAKKYGKFVYLYEQELIQEGYIALIAAWNTYNPERGTFVTLAWLRVDTALKRELNRQAKEFKKTNRLEHLSFEGGEVLTWEDMFASDEVDYAAICRLACKDSIDAELVYGLVEGITKKDMAVWIGVTHEDMLERYDFLKEEMVAVVNELYEGEDKK